MALFTALESYEDTQNDIQETVGIDVEGSEEPLNDLMDEAAEIAADVEVESHAQALDEDNIQKAEAAVEGLESLAASLEAYLERGGMTAGEAVMLNHALAANAALMGVRFKEHMMPSMESYTDSAKENTQAALEGIGDTIKAGANKVWEMIKNAIKWLGEQIGKIGNLFGSQDKAAEQIVATVEVKIKVDGDKEVEVSAADAAAVEGITEDLKAAAEAEKALEAVSSQATAAEEGADLESRIKEAVAKMEARKAEYEKKASGEGKVKIRLSKLLASLKEFVKFKGVRAKIAELGKVLQSIFNKLMSKVKSTPAAEAVGGLPVPVYNQEEAKKRSFLSKLVSSIMSAFRSLMSFVSGACARFLGVFKRNKDIIKGAVLDKNGKKVGDTTAAVVPN